MQQEKYQVVNYSKCEGWGKKDNYEMSLPVIPRKITETTQKIREP